MLNLYAPLFKYPDLWRIKAWSNEAEREVRVVIFVMIAVLRMVSYKLSTGETGYRADIIRQIAENGLAAIQDFKGAP